MFRKYRRNYGRFKGFITLIGLLILAQFVLVNFKLTITLAFTIFVHLVCKKFGFYRKISKARRIISSGKKGEYKVNNILKKINLENILLYDINLRCDECESQIDHILITHKGIYSIETKNYAGTINIDSNGVWKQITHRGEFNIDNFAKQALQHRRTLTKILKEKYKINDIIVIANYDTKIIGSENSKIPIININNLSKYIDNIEVCCSDYDLEEISQLIKLYQIPLSKKVIKNTKYFIKDNKVAICLSLTIVAIFYSIIRPLPNSLLESKEEPNNIISVSNINKTVDLKSLNTKVNVIKLSKYKKQIVINIDITNNSKEDYLDLGWFNFSVSDVINKLYTAEGYIGDDYIIYGSIKPLETKQLTLKVDNTNNIKVNKLVIKYDDIQTNKFEKELGLLKYLN
ncbi:NERD domain-containing protein [Clostridium bowmanii]|uniref:nuclease-related domain-containing protein n=1 Tax=Clostridium bowmanii TaxID=132925 RepID=UPI001C0DD74A|nr:nuclease-related domain-containing protein [Clostridium bowmanii]MBU3191901.1 NERD domain-containing protein [Clostridium bowmanii]MCA1076202.1 NERD domain-containing protein [Clostridium bowmanii]